VPTERNIAVIGQVREYLQGHYVDVPSLPQLAAMAGMSRSHFSRTFHAVVGTPLRQYVGDLRLQRACALLTTSTLSLTAIAMECGFYDLPHFDKAFRRRFGTAPQQFRQRANGAAAAAPAPAILADGLQQRSAANTARARALVTRSQWLIAQSLELERRHRRWNIRGGSGGALAGTPRVERTRARVRTGEVDAAPSAARLVAGTSRGGMCDGCLDVIVRGTIEYEAHPRGGTLRFHPGCWCAWMSACSPAVFRVRAAA
jgi:AraC-like DNA-binding protein